MRRYHDRGQGDPVGAGYCAGVHGKYESTVLPMKDGLPKLKDLPTGLGGTGETIAE